MNPSYTVGFVICLTGTMSTAMMMILQHLILMMDIPLDMIQIDSPEGSSFDPAEESSPVTIQIQHQPLKGTVPALSAVPVSADYYFYSTPIRKSKGTSHCSINSKSFTVHRRNHSESLLLSVETAFTSVKANYSPWFQQSPAASKAPSSLYNEAKPSVFIRSKTSTTANRSQSPSSTKVFTVRNTLEVQSSFRNSHLNTVYQL